MLSENGLQFIDLAHNSLASIVPVGPMSNIDRP